MADRSRWLLTRGVFLAGVVLLAGAACRLGTPPQRGLDSSNPLDRAQAVISVTERGDLTAVHKLVDLLGDRDEGVRMFAIMGLRRLCREDFGYRYYAAAPARAQAIERWQAALRQGTLTVPQPGEASGRGGAGKGGGS